MDKICCLCRLSLPADSRKMMRLHGRSCEKANPAAVPLDSPLDHAVSREDILLIFVVLSLK